MYGAGNIGRGFIGQVFSNSGYSVGFVDINQEVISTLNKDHSYPVKVVSNDGVTIQPVNNVYGIDGTNVELVSDEIASADVMATAIGVNVLKFIAKPIALGLKKRFLNNAKPFNIIICENLIGADEFLRNLIIQCIPEYEERIKKEVGFVEASIGRMVPVLEKEPGESILTVAVEPYNILPVDKDAFKGEIPNVSNLFKSEEMKTFFDSLSPNRVYKIEDLISNNKQKNDDVIDTIKCLYENTPYVFLAKNYDGEVIVYQHKPNLKHNEEGKPYWAVSAEADNEKFSLPTLFNSDEMREFYKSLSCEECYLLEDFLKE
jgi:hypothetical protein